MVRIRKLALIGASALALVGVSAAAVSQTPLGARAAETYRMLELFGDVLTVVERTYVESHRRALLEAGLHPVLARVYAGRQIRSAAELALPVAVHAEAERQPAHVRQPIEAHRLSWPASPAIWVAATAPSQVRVNRPCCIEV